MSLSQLTAGARSQLPKRWLPEALPQVGPVLSALALVALAAGVFGLIAPALDAGVYVLLAPLALGLAALILVRPEVGLALMFLTAPLETTYLDVGFKVKPQQVIGLLTVAGFGLQFAVGQRKLLRSSSLNKPLFLLVLTFLFSFLMHPQFVSMGVSLFILQLWFIAVIFLAANFVDEPGVLRKCLWMFVTAGALEAVLAITQAAGFYETASPFMSYGSILNHARPPGTFSEPDFLAPFLVGSFLLIIPFWGNKRVGTWTPVIYAVVLLLLAASILAMVRASWLGMIAGLAAFGWLKLRERGEGLDFAPIFKRFGGIVAAVAVIAVALAALWPTAFSTVSVRAKNMVAIVEPENPHATRRNEMTQTWNVIKENPLIGHGVGTFAISTKYGQTVASTERARAGVVGAGTPLSLLHDQGAGGLAAFAALLGVLLWRLARASKTVGAAGLPYVQGAFACVIGLTASACFNNLYYFGYYWLIIALAAALTEPLWRVTRRSREAPETAR